MRRLTVIFFIILIVLSAFNFNFAKSDGPEASFVNPDNSSSDTSTKQIDVFEAESIESENDINKDINGIVPDPNLENKPTGTRAIGKETRITTNMAGQLYPAIYGDRIVWYDTRDAIYGNIYMYDLKTSTETQITPYFSLFPAIYDDRIVWQDERNGNWAIYMYDLGNSTETQITSDDSAAYPAIYGNRIVWMDNRNGNYDIYMYDLNTSTETRITMNSSNTYNPDIYGKKIVWVNYRNPNYISIYMYDLDTSKETELTRVFSPPEFIHPAIYGDIIVWHDNGGNIYDNIYMYDLNSGKETQITSNSANQSYPAIYGKRIVWMDERNGNWDIYMYDLGTNTEIQITTNSANQYGPAIYDNRIVWMDDRNGNWDIYMYEFFPSAPNPNKLNISKPFVYRPDVIELYSNAYDHEDLEKDLLPQFEYMGPDHTSWQTELLSPPEYKNDRWQSTFTIPINAVLGYYNFRVRYNDTDDMWSLWKYLNGSLRVLNNPPRIDHFNTSKHTVEIGESFQLFVNGTDVEDELQKLTFELEYKHYDDTLWDPLQFEQKVLVEFGWEYNITFDNTMEYGYYDLRAMVCDSDLGCSDWSELEGGLLVIPAIPRVISIDLSKHVILRTEIVEAYIECTDPDSDYDELFVELQYTADSDGLWHDLSTDPINLRWEASWKSKKTSFLGNYSFRAKAFDFEDNAGSWFYLNNSLMVLNNIPELLDINNIPDEMSRKESAIISIDAKDVENKEDLLRMEFEYREPEGSDWITGYLSALYYSNSSWHTEFTLPEDAQMGIYSFRARVQDLDGALSDHVYLNDSLSVGNGLPVVLSFEQYPAEVYRTESIIITASGTDPETSHEQLACFIYYQAPGSSDWSELTVQYNSSANNWQSEHITTITSVLGKYNFKTILMDNDGAFSMPVYAYGTVLVKNNLPVISDDLDDIEVGKPQKILKLMDFGYDVENSKDKLSWSIDPASIDTLLFHIDAEHIGDHELVINPVQGKNGRRDITLILKDSDDGRAEKTTVTIIVDSRAGSKADTEPDENPIIKLVGGTNILIYLLIIIMIIIFITTLFLVRRKKQKGKEDDQKKIEEQQQDAEADELAVVGEPAATSFETPIPVPVPTVEEPPVPTPVPMPTPFPTPILPVTTADAEPQPEIEEDASPQDDASEEPVQQVDETDDSGSGD